VIFEGEDKEEEEEDGLEFGREVTSAERMTCNRHSSKPGYCNIVDILGGAQAKFPNIHKALIYDASSIIDLSKEDGAGDAGGYGV